jgi:hypothetical protein
MLYMVTFTINIPPMLAYIPYMDPMGDVAEFFLGRDSRTGCFFLTNWAHRLALATQRSESIYLKPHDLSKMFPIKLAV